jgi:hypothetical protein
MLYSNQLTYPTQLSPSCGSNSRSACHGIPHLSRDPTAVFTTARYRSLFSAE